jgi:hypothetical protein
MSEIIEFVEFPKIARLSRPIIITEKIDGTNGCIYIGPTTQDPAEQTFLVGSRTRWITPEADNFGFAAWAYSHKDELMTLGPGRHFGEWWGSGIQRGYGLPKGEKRFGLFNVSRWCLFGQTPKSIPTQDPRVMKTQDILPARCGLVPIIYDGPFNMAAVDDALSHLAQFGSLAAPGFMNPEGIVVFHVAGNVGFKKTIEKDDAPKGVRP